MKKNQTETEENYKLYRKVKELLHPSISKRNISNYKINIGEDCLLLKVYYPKKVSNMEKIMIMIPGEETITDCMGMYPSIAASLSKDLDQVVIMLDYENAPKEPKELLKKVEQTVFYILEELEKEKRVRENITLVGDSTGATMVINCIQKLEKENISLGKMLLFYPVLSGKYDGNTKYPSIMENKALHYDLIEKLQAYFEKVEKNFFPLQRKESLQTKGLILSGNVDPLVDEAIAYEEQNPNISFQKIAFAYHGFLNTKDKEIKKEYKKVLIDFMKEEE